MSANIKQVYDANPTTAVPNTALLYLGLSPFANTDDSAITAQNLFASAPSIGTSSPGIGIFSLLAFPIDEGVFSVNTQVNPSTDLCATFNVDTAGVVMSAQVYANYIDGFQFWIKNSSAGDINFTPNGADNIEGNATLVITPNECVQIAKSVIANTWEIISNYNSSAAGGYLLASNNLSDLDNNTTAVNNLQLISNYQASAFVGADTLTLTNPVPSFVDVTGSGGNVVVKLPAMNVTTPGAKSMRIGQTIVVRNLSSDSSRVSFEYDSGAVVPISSIGSNQFVVLVLRDNSTSNGIVQFIRYGTAYQANASDQTKATVASINAAPNTDQFAIFTDTAGTIGGANFVAGSGISINYAAPNLTISATGNNPAVEVTGTSQAMAVNTVYIANNAGLVTLTLPVTAALGDEIEVDGKGAGLWRIAQNASQQIHFDTSSTTVGVGGSITSTTQYQNMKLRCITANNIWTVISSIGFSYTVV